MSEFLFRRFQYWFAREAYAEFLEDAFIDIAHHDGDVNLTSAQVGQLPQCRGAVAVGVAEHGERDEDLVGVQPRVAASEIARLCLLYRFYHALRYEFHVVVYAGEVFHGVEEQGGRASEQRSGL